jgi:hypothetical protein
VAESDDSLREHIVAVLSDAGYEVTTDYRGGMKAVVALNPDIEDLQIFFEASGDVGMDDAAFRVRSAVRHCVYGSERK